LTGTQRGYRILPTQPWTWRDGFGCGETSRGIIVWRRERICLLGVSVQVSEQDPVPGGHAGWTELPVFAACAHVPAAAAPLVVDGAGGGDGADGHQPERPHCPWGRPAGAGLANCSDVLRPVLRGYVGSAHQYQGSSAQRGDKGVRGDLSRTLRAIGPSDDAGTLPTKRRHGKLFC